MCLNYCSCKKFIYSILKIYLLFCFILLHFIYLFISFIFIFVNVYFFASLLGMSAFLTLISWYSDFRFLTLTEKVIIVVQIILV